MICNINLLLLYLIVALTCLIPIYLGQNYWNEIDEEKRSINITWCTTSVPEQYKCQNFSYALQRDPIRFGYQHFILECRQALYKHECIRWLDQEKATLTTLDAGQVFLGGRFNSLIPLAREVLSGGFAYYYAVAVIKKGSLPHVHSLHDLRGKSACFAGVETFAGWVLPIYTLMRQGGLEIIDCNNHVKSASKYFGPSCAVNSLSDQFNPIGDNSDKLCQLCTGKIPGGRCTDGDPYAGYTGAFRCLLEKGDIAFLKHTTVSEMISSQHFNSVTRDSFELLCTDGSRKSVDDYFGCNWGKVPTDAIVTSSAAKPLTRKLYQQFLQEVINRYGGHKTDGLDDRYVQSSSTEYDPYRNGFARQVPNQPYDSDNNQNYFNQQYSNNAPQQQPIDQFASDPFTINREEYGINIDPYQTDRDNSDHNRNRSQFNDFFGGRSKDRASVEFSPSLNFRSDNNDTHYGLFNLFESAPRYGIHGNLMFNDRVIKFEPVFETQQTYSRYLDQSMKVIMGVRDCPVGHMTLCVTSDAEYDKCVKMRTALKAQLLKPEMECHKGHSQIHCMQAIRSRVADVAVLDASDVYTAGLSFDLVPFISEVYNLNEPEYYVVAVSKVSDPDTELTYLRGKNTCHGGINTAAGWVYPMAFLLSNNWIRPYGCNSIRAAAEYFSKSCIPGALSTEYNTGVPYDNMCDLCHGASFRYCRRDASEDYYGHTGAFRCLVEGGGDVAFVKHTTVFENAGGKRKEWWARDNLFDDFQLLCPDGTRAEVEDYEKCNLGKVRANAIVTRGGYAYNETHINAFINIFLYAQTFYGRKTTDEFSFSMFSSQPPYTDLIFQDATTQLKVIEPSKRDFSIYLGRDYMRARRIVDCFAAGPRSTVLSFMLLLSGFIATIVGNIILS